MIAKKRKIKISARQLDIIDNFLIKIGSDTEDAIYEDAKRLHYIKGWSFGQAASLIKMLSAIIYEDYEVASSYWNYIKEYWIITQVMPVSLFRWCCENLKE